MAKKLAFYDNGSKELTMAEIEKLQSQKTELELRKEALLSEVVQDSCWKNVSLAAQMELDRREADRQKRLMIVSTRWSVAGGAIAAIVGAIFGAILTTYLQ